MKDSRRRERGRKSPTQNRKRSQAPTSRPTAGRPVAAFDPARTRLLSGRSLGIMVILAVLCAAVYAPLRNAEFVSYDDPAYVTENPHIAGGLTWRGLSWALSSGYAANWHPLTWMSHMLDVRLFGLNAGPHHLVSVFLHIANTLLLYLLLCRLTGAFGRSAFVAGLFALHPLHVQSVAWVAERKDVLSTLFLILALWAYAAYVHRPGWGRYLWVFILMAMGLASKPMLVTLPFVLLLLDLWPLGRSTLPGRRDVWLRLVVEKIPLFALAAASSVVTYIVQQRSGAVAELQKIPLNLRVENALASYLGYIGKMFWPDRLAVLYPLPPSYSFPIVAAAALLLTGITLWVVRTAGRRPYLATGWFWYLGTLVPVIGIVQVGLQAMADRYTYVPLIGLFIMAAWGIPDLFGRLPGFRVGAPIAAALVLLAAAFSAHAQVGHWHDSVTLWGREVEVAMGMEKAHAHSALGMILREQGRTEEAMGNFAEAIRLDPDVAEAHYGLGLILASRGEIDRAIASFSEAVRLKPDLAPAHVNLGRALASRGEAEAASRHFEKAIRLEAEPADVYRDLGRSLLNQGKADEAIAAFSEAVRLNPDYAEAESDLGFVLATKGKIDEAVSHLTRALQLRPGLAEAHVNLGSALVRAGRTEEAMAHFAEAARLQPDFELAHLNLGIGLMTAGRIDEAIDEFKEVLRINPGNTEIRRTLEALTRRAPIGGM